jgi:hypothetical protein
MVESETMYVIQGGYTVRLVLKVDEKVLPSVLRDVLVAMGRHN